MEYLDKIRQKKCLTWLKNQSKKQSKLMRYSILLGFLIALMLIAQAGILAIILQKLIIENDNFNSIFIYFLLLILVFIIRSLFIYCREQINYKIGQKMRHSIRKQLIDKIDQNSVLALSGHSTGGLSTLLIEQVENVHDFYARFLPQMKLASLIPVIIVLVILPLNWAVALILLITAPLIPIFMILVGMGAADVNRKNFKALSLLSGHFLDRLKGLQTIKLFNQGDIQAKKIHEATENFRIRTMNVLKMAFLSASVLEFFTSISIAIVAVYFGFSYLGEINFGHYNTQITLFIGFFALILAPEFFQPLRDLGAYYHAKAAAIAAADNLENFLTAQVQNVEHTDNQKIASLESIFAKDLIILSPDNQKIVGPLNFELIAPFKLSLMGVSGVGKTSLFNVLMGFLPYQGSLKINQIELKSLDITEFRSKISWLGQNPYLINGTIADNILLADKTATKSQLNKVIEQANLSEFVTQLPNGIDTQIGEDAVRISVGQAQRIALARALLKSSDLLLLDEPTASLDDKTAQDIERIIKNNHQNKNLIMITHQQNTNINFNLTAYLTKDKLEINKEN